MMWRDKIEPLARSFNDVRGRIEDINSIGGVSLLHRFAERRQPRLIVLAAAFVANLPELDMVWLSVPVLGRSSPSA